MPHIYDSCSEHVFESYTRIDAVFDVTGLFFDNARALHGWIRYSTALAGAYDSVCCLAPMCCIIHLFVYAYFVDNFPMCCLNRCLIIADRPLDALTSRRN